MPTLQRGTGRFTLAGRCPSSRRSMESQTPATATLGSPIRTARRMRRIPPLQKRPIDEEHPRAVMRAVARRIIHLTEEIKAHEKTLRSLVKEAAPQLLEEFGSALCDCISSLRRMVAFRAMPQRSRLRPACWRRTNPHQLWTDPGPLRAKPERRPSTQQGAAHHRRHKIQSPPQDTDLRAETASRTQDRPGDPTLHQVPHRPENVATPRTATSRRKRGSTDIEASIRFRSLEVIGAQPIRNERTLRTGPPTCEQTRQEPLLGTNETR
jgi:hypothetical protein